MNRSTVSSVNTLQQEAVIQIKRLITNGEIKLGERINEVELSQKLNMSRGPIRESLRILNQEGLVTYFPRRGMFVTNLEKEDINEIYDIRFHLEKIAVELGFHYVNDKIISELYAIVEEMKKYSMQNRKDLLVELDLQFHEKIVTLPKYNRLFANWQTYNALIELIFAKVFELGTETADDIFQNHHYLVKTLEKRDKNEFIAALQAHYMTGKEKLLSIW